MGFCYFRSIFYRELEILKWQTYRDLLDTVPLGNNPVHYADNAKDST